MQFLRTIVESNRLEHVVKIPKEFRNQKVEVLILPLPAKKRKTRKEFNPDDFEGILNIEPNVIEEEIESMRDEWERA